MQTNWKKTTITFIFAGIDDQPIKIVLQNAVNAPAAKQVEDFGTVLSGLTGLPFRNAVVSSQSAVA
ncbi:hypothetical protein [Levilactobacillus parabrevis]|uniref:DUF1659 domain-containing protein n=1 Tax=Levilactobacillus parabrevis ATCC 53295 TaxID=1267003 RepID=A0A0R1H093_9LACO|nr:hypothetical protein [Levilactobacillus parabrevis]KRK39417.1 hypothetical protein FD07_GL001215 [Levilactobacillus parabrevis ATCC 53295]KRO07318.1 hypothetical protein IV61_GL000129 [Levilactobacillus parabrevis]